MKHFKHYISLLIPFLLQSGVVSAQQNFYYDYGTASPALNQGAATSIQSSSTTTDVYNEYWRGAFGYPNAANVSQIMLVNVPTQFGMTIERNANPMNLTLSSSNTIIAEILYDTAKIKMLPPAQTSNGYWGAAETGTYELANDGRVFAVVQYKLTNNLPPNSGGAFDLVKTMMEFRYAPKNTAYHLETTPILYRLKAIGNVVLNTEIAMIPTAGIMRIGSLSGPIHNPPVLKSDESMSQSGVAVSGDLKTNDYLPTGGGVFGIPVLNSGPSGATFTLNSAGTYSFSATTPGVYEYKVPVTIKTGNNGSGTQVFYETVKFVVTDKDASNNPVLAANDYIVTRLGQNTTLKVLENDLSTNTGRQLNVGSLNLGGNASYTTPAGGVFTVNATNGTINYVPAAANVNGTNAYKDSVKYTICDNSPVPVCNDAWAFVDVDAQLPAPNRVTSNNDAVLTYQNKPVTGNLLSNDQEPNGLPLKAKAETINIPGKGVLEIAENGIYTFSPTPNFTGSLTIPYKAYNETTNDLLRDTAIANITIFVKPFEAMPDMAVTQAGTATQGSVADNDNMPKGVTYGPLTARPGNPGTEVPVIDPATGVYTFPAVVTPGTYTFEVQVCAAAGVCTATPLTITVTDPKNTDAKPVANPDITGLKQNHAGGTSNSVSVNPLSNDASGNFGGQLDPAITVITPALHGNVTVDPLTGMVSYTPNPGFTGQDSLKYQVCETGTNKCSSAWMYFSVYPTDPLTETATGINTTIAADDYVRVLANSGAVSVNLLANDKDPEGHTQTIQDIASGAIPNGTYTINNGILAFTPNAGFVGVVAISYTVSDNGNPVANRKGTAYVEVYAAAPDVKNDHMATTQGKALTGDVSTNDIELSGFPLVYNTTPAQAPANGTVIINPDGTFAYTPAASFMGVDSFKYTVCNTKQVCNTAWAYVSVIPPAIPPGLANRAPIAQNDESTTFINQPVSGNISRNDVDPDGNTLTYTVLNTPGHGTIVLNADGTFTYTPASGFQGNDTARIRVCDNGSPSLCDTTVLTVSVKRDPSPGVNDAPDANDDIVSTIPNATVTGNVLLNDRDPNGDVLSASIIGTVPPGFSMNSNGNFTYAPPATAVDTTITVRYVACDNGTPSKCDTASLYIAVRAKIADLTILSAVSSPNISAAAPSTNLVLTAVEIFGGRTRNEVRPVYIRLLKNNDVFTYSYDPNQTTINAPMATNIENNKWELVSENNDFILFRLKPGNNISAYGLSSIGIKLSLKPGATKGVANITSLIVNNSGGDLNHVNNSNNRFVNVQ